LGLSVGQKSDTFLLMIRSWFLDTDCRSFFNFRHHCRIRDF